MKHLQPQFTRGLIAADTDLNNSSWPSQFTALKPPDLLTELDHPAQIVD